MTLTIHIHNDDVPWPDSWCATHEDYDGTRCEHDPSQEDRRIATGTTKWEALRNLIDAMEDVEDRQKVKASK